MRQRLTFRHGKCSGYPMVNSVAVLMGRGKPGCVSRATEILCGPPEGPGDRFRVSEWGFFTDTGLGVLYFSGATVLPNSRNWAMR